MNQALSASRSLTVEGNCTVPQGLATSRSSRAKSRGLSPIAVDRQRGGSKTIWLFKLEPRAAREVEIREIALEFDGLSPVRFATSSLGGEWRTCRPVFEVIRQVR